MVDKRPRILFFDNHTAEAVVAVMIHVTVVRRQPLGLLVRTFRRGGRSLGRSQPALTYRLSEPPLAVPPACFATVTVTVA